MKPELIVHIGMGKTGTSSIQTSLKTSKAELKKKRIKYLGYNLNHCRGPKLDEQCFKAGKKDPRNHDILKSIILKTLEFETGKYDKLIISNERLFQRVQYTELFKSIENEGYRVTIITYIRRPDLWARSAYAQWGIKHKSYQGIVRTFDQGAKDKLLHYSNNLIEWQKPFSDSFIVRNYEEITDVVADFFNLLDLKHYSEQTSNKTVSNEYLALWAIYNSMQNEPLLPNHFTDFMKGMDLPKKQELDIENLLPCNEDLEAKFKGCHEEITKINDIFTLYNEPPLHDRPPKIKAEGLNTLKLIQHLTEMVFAMDQRIQKLEKATVESEGFLKRLINKVSK